MDTGPILQATLPMSTLQEAPIVLDIEASGFGHGSYPIEVGFVMADGKSCCMLIQPLPQWTHWDVAAERLHRISRETLLKYGRPPAEVVETLNSKLFGCTVYTDGWAHDYTWLALLFDVVHRVPSFRLESLRALLSEDESARWHLAKQDVANAMTLERHRASADARLLQATFMRLRAGATKEKTPSPVRNLPSKALLEIDEASGTDSAQASSDLTD
jgi:hypothetical protein